MIAEFLVTFVLFFGPSAVPYPFMVMTPRLFVDDDGTRIESESDWWNRHHEIVLLVVRDDLSRIVPGSAITTSRSSNGRTHATIFPRTSYPESYPGYALQHLTEALQDLFENEP